MCTVNVPRGWSCPSTSLWAQDAYLGPATLCHLISDISKLELESDITADFTRTSLTKCS